MKYLKVVLISLVLVNCGGSDSNETELLSLSELKSACTRASACGIQTTVQLKTCIESYYNMIGSIGQIPIYNSIYQCINKAKGNCEKAKACLGAQGACTKDDFKARCDGSNAVSCDLLDNEIYSINCGLAGLGCEISSSQNFVAECVCTQSFSGRCDGNIVVSCFGSGEPTTTNCADQGRRCIDGRCEDLETQTCKYAYARCIGNSIEICTDKGTTHFNCEESPYRRRCNGAECTYTYEECIDELNRCSENGVLEACVDGKWESIDCKTLGLGPCQELTYGANCSELS